MSTTPTIIISFPRFTDERRYNKTHVYSLSSYFSAPGPGAGHSATHKHRVLCYCFSTFITTSRAPIFLFSFPFSFGGQSGLSIPSSYVFPFSLLVHPAPVQLDSIAFRVHIARASQRTRDRTEIRRSVGVPPSKSRSRAPGAAPPFRRIGWLLSLEGRAGKNVRYNEIRRI